VNDEGDRETGRAQPPGDIAKALDQLNLETLTVGGEMARVNAKGCVLVSDAAAHALGHLSKTLLVDLCFDMLRRMEGADTDEAALLERLSVVYLPPVCRARGETAADVVRLYQKAAGAAESRPALTPCGYCNDTGRVADPEGECTHCRANASDCPGCTYEMCPCHRNGPPAGP
jgi:hypothetical protein